MSKMNEIKDHFDKEARFYDEIILKLIPYYKEMVNSLVSSIPCDKEASIQVLDLGCGTGSVSKAILEKYPNAKFTILDISKEMLNIAGNKIGSKSIYKSICRDFYELNLEKKYDVVASSLALHHLITNEDKKEFYSKIFNMLKPNGIFLNADVVLGSNEHFQNNNMEKWVLYMNKSFSINDITSNWLVKYKNEDKPARLIDQIKWLEDIGFSDVDVIWKHYNFAVYGGLKKQEDLL